MPQQFVARFLEAETPMPMNAIVRLAVPASVAAAATPGQFVLLGAGQGRDPLLLRPYSIMRAVRAVSEGEGALDLLVFTGGVARDGWRRRALVMAFRCSGRSARDMNSTRALAESC